MSTLDGPGGYIAHTRQGRWIWLDEDGKEVAEGSDKAVEKKWKIEDVGGVWSNSMVPFKAALKVAYTGVLPICLRHVVLGAGADLEASGAEAETHEKLNEMSAAQREKAEAKAKSLAVDTYCAPEVKKLFARGRSAPPRSHLDRIGIEAGNRALAKAQKAFAP